MSVAGDPSLWADVFPERLLPDVILLLIDTWAEFEKPTDREDEEAITKRFRRAVAERNRKLEAVPVRVDREIRTDRENEGRIDIRFTHGYSDREYFALEAKKVNRPKRSNVGEYVGVNGMTRFVSQKYGAGQCHGGMIAYVMDGDCDRAIRLIRVHVSRSREALMLSRRTRLRRSRLRGRLRHVYETEHLIGSRTMLIQHLMLPA